MANRPGELGREILQIGEVAIMEDELKEKEGRSPAESIASNLAPPESSPAMNASQSVSEIDAQPISRHGDAVRVAKTQRLTEGQKKFFKRVDRRYSTKDCPVGLKVRQQRAKLAAVCVLVLSGLLGTIAWWHYQFTTSRHATMTTSTESLPDRNEHHFAPIHVEVAVPNSSNLSHPSPTRPHQTAALPPEVPQKDGLPLGLDGKPIAAGTKYVTKYTRLEFISQAPGTVVNIPLKSTENN